MIGVFLAGFFIGGICAFAVLTLIVVCSEERAEKKNTRRVTPPGCRHGPIESGPRVGTRKGDR